MLEDILKSRKALFVGAHPDDIEFYSAALVRMLRENGAEVVYAIGTRGGKGWAGRARMWLERRRTRDQMKSARIIGGAKVVFFDYPDKGLPAHVTAYAQDLRALIGVEEPDIVFSWDPDFIYNPHPDHVAAAQAAESATEDVNVHQCFYGTRKPDLWVGYGDDIMKLKIRALRAHSTETIWPFFLRGKRYLMLRSAGEGAKIGAKYAEVFRNG